MNRLLLLFALAFSCSICRAERAELRMSLRDRFVVEDSADWKVSVTRSLLLRFADVQVEPKGKSRFALMLYFKCDTKDLAQYDTPAKMQRAVEASSQKYVADSVERKVVLEPITNRGWYGWKTQFTDATLVGKQPIPSGQYVYLIRGMIRLSQDSALGFSLMTNDPKSDETARIMTYIYGFAKPKADSP